MPTTFFDPLAAGAAPIAGGTGGDANIQIQKDPPPDGAPPGSVSVHRLSDGAAAKLQDLLPDLPVLKLPEIPWGTIFLGLLAVPVVGLGVSFLLARAGGRAAYAAAPTVAKYGPLVLPLAPELAGVVGLASVAAAHRKEEAGTLPAGSVGTAIEQLFAHRRRVAPDAHLANLLGPGSPSLRSLSAIAANAPAALRRLAPASTTLVSNGMVHQ